nr:MAG TPA: Single-stranded DNA-binding protein [Caudoviricetes sp.]
MANKQTGRVLAIGQTQSIALKDGKTLLKRELLLDCTRFDPYTGVRDTFENTPLFEFSGDKGVAMLDGIQVGQVVSVSFDLQGTRYEKDGQAKYFTRVRPYAIEDVKTKTQQQAAQQPAPQPKPQYVAPQPQYAVPQPTPQAAPQDNSNLPF